MARGASASWYQRLVERWADLTGWSTAKKTVVAMTIAAVFHTVVGLIAVAVLGTATDLVDGPGFARANAVWTGVVLAILVLALVPMLRGREGRWTAYLVASCPDRGLPSHRSSSSWFRCTGTSARGGSPSCSC